MIKKIELHLDLFFISNIIFLLSIFTLKVNAETKIIAKSGDTLFKISKQYGVPLRELMHKNNFNDANRVIEGEVIVIPKDKNMNELLTYKVIEGDTLYKIARDYKLNVKDIISINNLEVSEKLKNDTLKFLETLEDLDDVQNVYTNLLF